MTQITKDQFKDGLVLNDNGGGVSIVQEEVSDDSKEKGLVTILVDVNNEEKEKIVIRSKEDVDVVVKCFALKYHLSDEVEFKFKESIKQSIEEVLAGDVSRVSQETGENAIEELEATNKKLTRHLSESTCTPNRMLKKSSSRQDFTEKPQHKKVETIMTEGEVVNIYQKKISENDEGNEVKKRKGFGPRLYQKAIKQRENKQKLTAKILKEREDELQAIPFKPMINSKSRQLLQSSLLHTERKERQNIKEEEVYPFKPKINEYSNKLIKMKRSISRGKNLQGTLSKSGIEKGKRAVNGHSAVREELHRPKTGRGPKIKRSMPIGDHLYSQGKKRNELVASLTTKKHIQKDQLHNQSHTRKESNKIVKNLKAKSFIEIFKILDQDGDGIISVDTIYVTSIFN